MKYRKVSKVRGGGKCAARGRGQSLVEFAITLPILLIILMGLAELGSALYSYQIVVNAAREGARYGAKAHHTPDESVAAWARQTAARLGIVTEIDGAPALDGEKATVIVTHLRKVYDDDDEEYTYEHINTHSEGGDRPSVLTEEWFATQAGKSDELHDENWPQGMPSQAMDLIAVEVMYDHPHLTGLFNIGRFIPNPVPLHSLTVMRIGGSRMPSCDAYPIALNQDTIEDKEPGDDLGDIYNGPGSGNFGWMRWPDDPNANNAPYLADSLEDPGLSRRDYDNPLDPSDNWLNTDDWVYGNPGISGASEVRDALDDLIDRKIRVPVWGPDDDPLSDGSEGSGNNLHYHIVGFAWVMIYDYELAGENMISAVFHGWDDTCTGTD